MGGFETQGGGKLFARGEKEGKNSNCDRKRSRKIAGGLLQKKYSENLFPRLGRLRIEKTL